VTNSLQYRLILGWPKSFATLANIIFFTSVAELFAQPNIIYENEDKVKEIAE